MIFLQGNCGHRGLTVDHCPQLWISAGDCASADSPKRDGSFSLVVPVDGLPQGEQVEAIRAERLLEVQKKRGWFAPPSHPFTRSLYQALP